MEWNQASYPQPFAQIIFDQITQCARNRFMWKEKWPVLNRLLKCFHEYTTRLSELHDCSRRYNKSAINHVLESKFSERESTLQVASRLGVSIPIGNSLQRLQRTNWVYLCTLHLPHLPQTQRNSVVVLVAGKHRVLEVHCHNLERTSSISKSIRANLHT